MFNHITTGEPGRTRRKREHSYSLALAVISLPFIFGLIHDSRATILPGSVRPLATAYSSAPERAYVSFSVRVTAYSSSVDETDSTPFTTASGTQVEDGIIAANFLPFGTKVMIPELFGDRIFTVEDRMHRRKTGFVDIWMPSKESAKEFGIHEAEIYILSA